MEKSRRRYGAVEEAEVSKLEKMLSTLSFEPFTVSDSDPSSFVPSLVDGKPHKPYLGAERFGDVKMIGKPFVRNPYLESIGDVKEKIESEGFAPANLREVMSWAIKNKKFIRGKELYFIAAPAGKSITATMRFSFTLYAGVFWDKSISRMVAAHTSSSREVLYLGVKVA
jgi:hypothetical protein